ncbi:MAG: hypothetical protein M3N54_03635, partial [Acidobacteriota bacterium]|nr:hypothetical protein [Acidobacteriota bacterium]
VVRHTENTTFQPGRTVRHTTAPRGTLRRISTAVLVDQSVRWDGAGSKARKTLVPPSAEVLKVVHDVVAGVTGFSEQRGDVITVETLPFESTLAAEPPMPIAPSSGAQPLTEPKQPLIIGGAAALLLICLAGWFLVVRKAGSARASARDISPAAVEAADIIPQLQPQQVSASDFEQQIADNQAERAQLDAETMSSIRLPGASKKSEVLARHIREAVQKDPVSAANTLRSWLADAGSRRSS